MKPVRDTPIAMSAVKRESPRHKLHRELLESAKTLESWATDDTTLRQCRAYLNAAELVRQAARSIPLDESEVKR